MAMKRPVVFLMLALILGEILAVAKVHVAVYAVCVPVFLVQRIITKKWNLFFVVIFLFCFLGYAITENQLEKPEYLHSFSEQNVTVTGTYKKSAKTAYGYQYYMENVSVVLQSTDEIIELEQILIYSDKEPEFKVGNTIEVKGKMQQFNTARNYGNFDSKEYYKSLGIYVNIKENRSCVVNENYYYFQNKMQILRKSIKSIFEELCNENNEGVFSVCDEDKSTIFQAIIIGDKSDLPEEIKAMYQVSGISHLLAISGLHISTIGICIFKVFRKRFKFPISCSVSMIVVLGFVFMSGAGISSVRACGMFMFYIFSQMLGRKYDMLNSISFVVIITCLANPFILFDSAFQMSFGAIFAIVLVNPVLSDFLGVKDKKKIVKQEIKKKKYMSEKIKIMFKNLMLDITKSLIVSISINLILLPILTYNYFEISCYSIILNIIVIPLMSPVLIAAIIAVVIVLWLPLIVPMGITMTLARVVIMPGCIILELYERLCNFFSHLPGNTLITGKPLEVNIFVYYIVLTVGLFGIHKYLKVRKKKEENREKDIPKNGKIIEVEDRNTVIKKCVAKGVKIASIIVYAIFLLSVIIYRDDGRMRVVVNDVGQGDGILIRKGDFVVMVDGGSTDVKNVGEYRLVPTMKAQGIAEIDYLIITHADEDHINGVMELLENKMPNRINIENLLLPTAIIKDEKFEEIVCAATKSGIKVQYIKKGDYIKCEELLIKCLHPDEGFKPDARNNYSTVLELEYGDFSMLLTGDISAGEERHILPEKERGVLTEERYVLPEGEGQIYDETKKKYTVLKVAHHGSKNSTTADFLEEVCPYFSVISCGVDNSYGHPHAELLQRLKMSGTATIRTDLNGQITFSTDGKELNVDTFLE